jgi:NADPH:quinone reductase-like Zn-dependent oxidoreductase
VKAAMRDRYGGPETVEIRDIDVPVPTEDRILVKVQAASVNRADLDGLGPRWQFTRLLFGIRAPRIKRLGLDVAGVVEAVGPSVTRFKPGDRVFADLFLYGQGAFAEYVCAREKAFLSIPDALSFEDAATLPHSAVLAAQGLRLGDGRAVGAGDRVMIVGASGNVGPFAVQIAKARGAEVTGVCRTEKIDFVRSLGADHVIDYTTTDYTRPTEPFDWIVDVDAHHSIARFRGALKPGGVYQAMGGSSAWLFQTLVLWPFFGRRGGGSAGLLLGWKPFDRADVESVLELIAAGKVRPVIDRTFPLSGIVDALRYVDSGEPKGKVLILPATDPAPTVL